jgi:hypothetical protein
MKLGQYPLLVRRHKLKCEFHGTPTSRRGRQNSSHKRSVQWLVVKSRLISNNPLKYSPTPPDSSPVIDLLYVYT